jgi:hypothetical protein
MPVTTSAQEIEERAQRFSYQFKEALPPASKPRITAAMIKRFEINREIEKQLAAALRQFEPTREQTAHFYTQFKTLKADLEEGLIQIRARYEGDPRLRELISILSSMIKICDDLLIDLKVLEDAYEGRAPVKIRSTLGKRWAALLDHILLYHELRDREKDTDPEISLEELDEKYGL